MSPRFSPPLSCFTAETGKKLSVGGEVFKEIPISPSNLFPSRFRNFLAVQFTWIIYHETSMLEIVLTPTWKLGYYKTFLTGTAENLWVTNPGYGWSYGVGFSKKRKKEGGVVVEIKIPYTVQSSFHSNSSLHFAPSKPRLEIVVNGKAKNLTLSAQPISACKTRVAPRHRH